jgi:ADP-glucose pyrophosphorylase
LAGSGRTFRKNLVKEQDRCSVDADVFLENSILLPGSVISNGATLRSCIVGGVKVGGGTYQDTDFV